LAAFVSGAVGQVTIDGDDQLLGSLAQGVKPLYQPRPGNGVERLQTLQLAIQRLDARFDLLHQRHGRRNDLDQLGDVAATQQAKTAVHQFETSTQTFYFGRRLAQVVA